MCVLPSSPAVLDATLMLVGFTCPRLVRRYENIMRQPGGKGRFWKLVATHFHGRTPHECQERWRLLCAQDNAANAARSDGGAV